MFIEGCILGRQDIAHCCRLWKLSSEGTRAGRLQWLWRSSIHVEIDLPGEDEAFIVVQNSFQARHSPLIDALCPDGGALIVMAAAGTAQFAAE